MELCLSGGETEAGKVKVLLKVTQLGGGKEEKGGGERERGVGGGRGRNPWGWGKDLRAGSQNPRKDKDSWSHLTRKHSHQCEPTQREGNPVRTQEGKP